MRIAGATPPFGEKESDYPERTVPTPAPRSIRRRGTDACAVYVSTGSKDAAEDLVAEAFARALSRWRQVRQHPAPQAWVVAAALNANVSLPGRPRRHPLQVRPVS